MNERSVRSVSISMSGIGLLITLSCFERSEAGELEIRYTHLEYPDGVVMQSVDKALNILAGDWRRFFIEQKSVIALSNVTQGDNELFDMIFDAEEPESMFISKYVLEYENGWSAYHRNAQRRIAQYSPMLYNPQAG